MKIALIGSTQFLDKFEKRKKNLLAGGHKVRIPQFDNPATNELEVCEYNRSIIEWADRVDVIWDNRSVGTLFDFGMAFALRKPIKIIYIESRAFENVFRLYENYGH